LQSGGTGALSHESAHDLSERRILSHET